MRDANMFDVVRVSDSRLIGEIIEIHGDKASVQVYEETSGLGPGAPVESTGMPLSVELGPGLIASIYDGIQRPLDTIKKLAGARLERGVEVPSLPRDKKWSFVPAASVGDAVTGGDIIGAVQETAVVSHKIMVPVGVQGTIKSIAEGDFTVNVENRQLVTEIFNMISEKEKSVLTLVSDGYEYTEIAEKLQDNPTNVERIMLALRRRMAARFPDVAALYRAEVSFA